MRTHRVSLVLLALAGLAHAGCSALIDSSKYLGGGANDGGLDDGEVPPDGEIPPDGELPNRPPVLTTVALSTYMPTVGDAIRATPGPVIDPDGDTTTVRYQWFVADAAMAGATTATLATTPIAAGSSIRLEAWAYDGDLEGPHVSAGPITLSADVTRWRPVLAAPFVDIGAMVYDEANRRHVRIGTRVIWEYSLDAGGDLHVAPIEVGGAGPAEDEERLVAIMDHEGRRAIVIAVSTGDAFALDLSRRGGETWSPLAIAGIGPAPRFGIAVWVQPTGRRAWVFGGLNESASPAVSDEIYALDLTPGSERWTRQSVGGAAPPQLFGAVLAGDPTVEGAMILAGGAEFGGSDVTIAPEMYRLTPGAGDTITSELLTAELPDGGFASAAATDYANDRIVIAGGATDIDTMSSAFGVVLFDPAAGTFVDPATPGVGGGFLGLVHVDPDQPTRALHFRGFQDSDALDVGFDLRAIDLTTGMATPLANEVRPPAVSEASFMSTGGGEATLLYGRLEGGVPSATAYTLDLRSGEWAVLPTLPDAVSGMSPAPAYGNIAMRSSTRTGLQMWSGMTGDVTFADGQLWELLDGGRWLHRTLRMGTPPVARRGAAFVASGECGADQNYLFGGEAMDGSLLQDAPTLVCDLGDRMRDCFWDLSAAGGSTPSVRAWATMGVDEASNAFVFGGRTGPSVSSNEVFSFDVCSGGPAPWVAVAIAGAGPTARHGHTMVYDRPDVGGLASFLIFGGTADGDRSTTTNDVWRLEITSSSTARWMAITPATSLRPPARAFHSATWDEGESRMIVFGGRDPYSENGDAWELLVRGP